MLHECRFWGVPLLKIYTSVDIKHLFNAWVADAASLMAIEEPPVFVHVYLNCSVLDDLFFPTFN